MSEQPSAPANGRASLFRKVAQVLGEIERVPKHGHNSYYNYDYATESDLVETVRPALSKAGLAMFATIVQVEALENNITRVAVDITLGCADTGEVWTSRWFGDGQDKGEKGIYKAYTGAIKYWLMKTFLVSTGDDPEDDGAQPKDKAQPARPPAREQSRPAQKPANPPAEPAGASPAKPNRTALVADWEAVWREALRVYGSADARAEAMHQAGLSFGGRRFADVPDADLATLTASIRTLLANAATQEGEPQPA